MAEVNTNTSNGMQRTQIAPVETILPKSRFWSSYMMNGPNDFLPTRFVEWDYFTKGNPMAHYVGEGLTVPPTERSRFKTAQIETPLYQHRKLLGLHDLKDRQPGEPYGAMSPSAFKTAQERAGKLEAEDDIECIEAVAELREKAVCEFLFKGLIRVRGYGVDRIIDYSLPHKFQLLGSDRWGEVGVDPIKDIREWNELLEDYGYSVVEVFMDHKSWDIIEENDKWLKQLDNQRVEKGLFAPEKAAEYGNAAFMATMKDPFVNIFVQRSKYFNEETGQMERHLPDNTIILITQESKRNHFAYGSIDYMEDGEFKTVSGEFIKEVWHDDRAATREILVTSRCVPVPGNLNSWLVATVR